MVPFTDYCCYIVSWQKDLIFRDIKRARGVEQAREKKHQNIIIKWIDFDMCTYSLLFYHVESLFKTVRLSPPLLFIIIFMHKDQYDIPSNAHLPISLPLTVKFIQLNDWHIFSWRISVYVIVSVAHSILIQITSSNFK